MSNTLKKINCIQQIRLCACISVMVSKISLIEKRHSALKASASRALAVSASSQHYAGVNFRSSASTTSALEVRRQCWRDAAPVANFLLGKINNYNGYLAPDRPYWFFFSHLYNCRLFFIFKSY